MTSIITRRRLTFGAAAASTLPILGRGASAQAPLGVGFVYVGLIGDHGYTWTHDQGRLALEKEYGAKIKTSFIENVAEGPDAARAIRQLAQAGNQLIFATSFGFMNPTIQVAKQFPKCISNTRPAICAPRTSPPTMRVLRGPRRDRHHRRPYVEVRPGRLCRLFPIPEVVMGINAFHLAARRVNPNFKTKVVWASTWYDPAKEADAAKALIDQGADMITRTPIPPPRSRRPSNAASSPSARPTCGLRAEGPSDRHRRRLVGLLHQARQGGHGRHLEDRRGLGRAQGRHGQDRAYNDAVTPAARAAADEVTKAIIAGTLHPFTGELKDQKGEVRLKAGETASDEMLSKMDWYVDGIQA
jgi:simple sugar transport system substrate-binding protein